MTALVTPDAVEAAARALHAPGCNHHTGGPSECDSRAMTALAAAAPLIAQQTLLDAADVAPTADIPNVSDWLTARAATLTPKEKS